MMKKFVALIVLAAIMAFAGAAFAADSLKDFGAVNIAEQNVSNVTVTVSDLPENARVSAHSTGAPLVMVDGNKITFMPRYKEGKYVYSVVDPAAAYKEVGTFTVWVVNVERGIQIADTVGASGDDSKDATIDLFKGFTLVDEDPDHPAAWEYPRGVLSISNIGYSTAPKFTIESDSYFSSGVALITVNGVLKYNGEFIEGAKDSGTIGSFYFVVSDYDVDKASDVFAIGGALKPIEFTISTEDEIQSVTLSGKSLTKGTDYTVAVADSKTTVTFAQDYLKTLPAGPQQFKVAIDGGYEVYFVVKVITGADPAKDVKMSIVPDKVGLGDPIVASLDVVKMNQITAVGFEGADITALSTFTSLEDEDGNVIGSTVHLPSVLTVALEENKKYTVVVSYDMGGEKSVSADFTVVRESTHAVPGSSVKPDAELQKQVPAAVSVDFGATQKSATLFEVKYALLGSDIPTEEYFDADGKLTGVAARALIDADEHLTPLPSVTANVASGHVAPITFVVKASDLVSGDHTINWADAHVYKVIADGAEMKSEWLTPARTMADVADGKFQIFDLKGEKLATTIVRNGGIDQSYRLVVYVKDGGKYDLDGEVNVSVIDPVVLGRRLPVSGGGSSSSCDAGMGLAGLAALAALALRKRSK